MSKSKSAIRSLSIPKECASVLETLAPRGAFEPRLRGLSRTGSARDLIVEERLEMAMATVMSRGDDRALGAKIHDAYGVRLPSGPERASNGVHAFVGTGPGVWLALFEQAGPLMASDLAASLAGLASVADQSSSYAVLRIAGASAREILSRGAFIDFDPSVFGPGSAAVTTISHVGVSIWQVDDVPTYDVALFRSYADSFWHWMTVTCAALGISVVQYDPSARG
jgi:sarcosine oxidase subunit gamma